MSNLEFFLHRRQIAVNMDCVLTLMSDQILCISERHLIRCDMVFFSTGSSDFQYYNVDIGF